MLDIWNGAGSQGTQQLLLDARQQLRRPLAQTDLSAALQEPYTRTAVNEIRNLFPRLPNPDLVMYVYPHLSGTEQAPVPGDDAGNRSSAWKAWRNPLRPRATFADEAALYAHNPSFTDHLPWVEYLDTEQCFLLDDNQSVGAVFELLPIGTEGREPDWLMATRDAIEDALQDSFDELDQAPWVAQFFCQDDNDFTPYLTRLTDYIQDNARGTVFTEAYLELIHRHLKAISKPGGLFEDKAVTRLPWRGNSRRVRLVIYRWLESEGEEAGLNPVQSLQQTCERVAVSLQACGVQSTRVDGRDAVNALFDQLPEGTVMSLTLVVKPQDVLEDQLNRLARKAIGENLASTQARQDVEEARAIIGRQHKLYRGTMAFYVRGHDEQQLHQRSVGLTNALLGAGLQPVREGDEVAACNSYLRWLPMAYSPARDTRNWVTTSPHRACRSTRVQLKPGAPVSLAPFGDAWRLVEQPDQVASLSIDEWDDEAVASRVDQRDVLGELEITARLMITGGEAKEEARLSRADRSLIRECILDAAQICVATNRQVLTRDVRNALLRVATDSRLPEKRRERAQEMGESIDLFCQGFEGELFDREGTPWPESDVTIVDLATYAREGYEAQMSISYISLMNTVNNLAERDQYLGRPIIMVTDEGHIITKNPLLAPFVVKGTKMWRKLGAWFWLATQNLADFPTAAQTMLNMIEWWICLNMPPAEIEEIARFKKLTSAQKALLLSAGKEPGKYTEGVVLSKKIETLFRAVPPSLYLALAMTEPEEKAERWTLMQENVCSELEAAFRVAERIDRARGIDPV
ncbi:hypothetical protein L1887_58330 [Cichorium endivia]|nr:hypothetical protein L1887_58330 [Cichorium endivia]